MFNLFKNKKPKQNNRLQIIISVDYQDNINIKYDYDVKDKDKSYKMGILLYCLNNKLLTKHFVEALLNSNDTIFTTEVINNWSSFDTITQQNSNDPIIQPLNAFSKNVK